jgi:hypothetical protein
MATIVPGQDWLHVLLITDLRTRIMAAMEDSKKKQTKRCSKTVHHNQMLNRSLSACASMALSMTSPEMRTVFSARSAGGV